MSAPLQVGYKHTDAGILPVDWKLDTLAGIVDPAFPICYGVVQVGKYVESGIPIVAIKFVKEIAQAPLHRTASNLEKPYVRSRPVGGDVLISIKGTIGRVGIVPKGFQGNISRELARLRIRRTSCPEYIAHQLESDATQERINRSVVGTTRLEFSIGAVRQFPLPLPPTLAEQRAIAAALSDVDGLLAKLDALIAKKRDLKVATMQQLLTGHKRLPGFSGEWEVKRLGDISHIKTGAKNNDDKVADGEYPLFVRSQTVERINSYSYDCEAILVPGEGGIGSIFHYINGKFDCHQRVYKISAFNAETCGKFVFFAMKHFFHVQASRNSVKATVDSLRLPTFLEFEFVAPSFEEQKAIAQALDDIDAELTALEVRREKTHALKQGMMQELLTGRIRLV